MYTFLYTEQIAVHLQDHTIAVLEPLMQWGAPIVYNVIYTGVRIVLLYLPPVNIGSDMKGTRRTHSPLCCIF